MAVRRRRYSSVLWLAAAVIAVVLSQVLRTPEQQRGTPGNHDAALVQSAFSAHRSGVWATLEGRVTRLLPDDATGARHQRFLLQLDNGLSLLVAHNIDLAPRVPLRVGDTLTLHGRYEWNAKGGVLHWTHADPSADPSADPGSGRSTGGWIEHHGQRYR